jgi:hypothetical protein
VGKKRGMIASCPIRIKLRNDKRRFPKHHKGRNR